MVLTASTHHRLPPILGIDGRVFLTSAYYSEQHQSSLDKNVQLDKTVQQFWPSLFAAAVTASSLRNDNNAAASCTPPDVSASNSKGGRRSRFDADTYLLDLNDASDRAFDLATRRGFTINDALTYSGATVSYSALWERVKRWKVAAQLEKKQEEDAAHCLANFCMAGEPTGEGGGSAATAATPQSNTATKGQGKKKRTTPPSDLGIATFERSPIPFGKKDDEALDVSIELMLDWVPKEKAKENMSKKRSRLAGLAHEKNWMEKANKDLK